MPDARVCAGQRVLAGGRGGGTDARPLRGRRGSEDASAGSSLDPGGDTLSAGQHLKGSGYYRGRAVGVVAGRGGVEGGAGSAIQVLTGDGASGWRRAGRHAVPRCTRASRALRQPLPQAAAAAGGAAVAQQSQGCAARRPAPRGGGQQRHAREVDGDVPQGGFRRDQLKGQGGHACGAGAGHKGGRRGGRAPVGRVFCGQRISVKRGPAAQGAGVHRPGQGRTRNNGGARGAACARRPALGGGRAGASATRPLALGVLECWGRAPAAAGWRPGHGRRCAGSSLARGKSIQRGCGRPGRWLGPPTAPTFSRGAR